MTASVARRAFLQRAGMAVIGLMGAPLIRPSRALAQGDRLVVAVGHTADEQTEPVVLGGEG